MRLMVRRSRPNSLNENSDDWLPFKLAGKSNKHLSRDLEIDVEVQEHPVKILEEIPVNSINLFSFQIAIVNYN